MLSLREAIDRGIRYNLRIVTSNESRATPSSTIRGLEPGDAPPEPLCHQNRKPGSGQAGYGQIQAGIARKALVVAYIDTFQILAVPSLAAILLLLFVKKPKQGQAAMAH